MASPTVSTSSRVGYLGPKGTFTEEALHTQPDLATSNTIPFDSFADILFAVAENELDFGFVAVENALEGAVNVTLDTLGFDVDLFIQREVVLPIEMNLIGTAAADLSTMTTVTSFPHAYAQCRTWLRENMPNAAFVASTSTADAAQMIAESGDTSIGAIANIRTAAVYGLDVLAPNIAETSTNATRFLLVAKEGIPRQSGYDKTSVVVFQKADTSGSLLEILQEFAARRINLSHLLSRPTKTALGDYCFMIDLEGHISDEVVADCLMSIRSKNHDVKFLGSYPIGGDHTPGEQQVASENQQRAEAWLANIRKHI